MPQPENREKRLRESSLRISQCLNLQEIFDTACEEIRQFIQADRVAILKFDPESNFDHGEFVAESIVDGLANKVDSVLTKRVHDHCFGHHYADYYFQGQYFACDDIYNNDLSPCYIDILAQFQIRANLVIPLFMEDGLWGLLCVHQCTKPCHWEENEVYSTQQLADQLTISMRQANLFQQLQQQLLEQERAEYTIRKQVNREALLRKSIQRISQTLELQEIFDITCEEVRQFIQADRVAIFAFDLDSDYSNGKFVAESVAQEFDSVLMKRVYDHSFDETYATLYFKGRYLALDDIYDPNISPCHIKILEQFQIRANLVIPVSLKEKLWGLMCIHQCKKVRHWEENDISLAQQLANQLSLAIQQSQLFEQLQQQLTEREKDQELLKERNQQLALSNLELARATRLKDEFLANMSHELRTPLNAILGLTEAFQENIFGEISEEQVKPLQIIEQSGNYLLELINDILDLAKIESGALELESASASISELCESSLTFVKQMAHKKGIKIEEKVPEDIPDLILDKRRIRQVLINLLNNAVKFTPRGGDITLEVTYHQPSMGSERTDLKTSYCLQFAISDTGIGIDKDQIKRLFQPFIQVDSALNRQYSGTGLGLALVKRIIELHRGEIQVTSEVGVGSCFTFRLPCTLPTSCSLVESETYNDQDINSPELRKTKPLILLAEDNAANRMLVESYLQARGYRLIIAQDGQAAITKAQSENPDLILMDIQMPRMDGLEATKHIRQDANLKNIPIIALTALAMKGDQERCLRAGANDYLSKPVNLKNLIGKIQELLTDQ